MPYPHLHTERSEHGVRKLAHAAVHALGKNHVVALPEIITRYMDMSQAHARTPAALKQGSFTQTTDGIAYLLDGCEDGGGDGCHARGKEARATASARVHIFEARDALGHRIACRVVPARVNISVLARKGSVWVAA
jgi:hypothetical protein